MMPRVILILLLLATGAGFCQFAAPPSYGIEGVLSASPFAAEVTHVAHGSYSFSLHLRGKDGAKNEITQFGGTDVALLSKAVSHLKVGQTYTFPTCLLEHLEPEEAATLRREVAPPTTASLIRGLAYPINGAGIAKFANKPMFRARVLDRVIGEDRYWLFMEADDGTRHDTTGDLKNADTRRIVEHLVPGHDYDFPTVMRHALLSPAARTQASRLRTSKLEELRPYIGEWQGHLDVSDDVDVWMKCAWLDDGSGMWRVITLDRKDGSLPQHDIAIIRHDEARGSFRVAGVAADAPAPMECVWDATRRCFTFDLPSVDGIKERKTVATFSTADRIDWKTFSRYSDGTIQSTASGSYERVQPERVEADDGAKWKAVNHFHWPNTPVEIDAEKSPPFVAFVLAKRQDEESVSLLLDCEFGRLLELSYPVSAGREKLPALYTKLEVGDVREFPDAMLHPDRVEPQKPASAALRQLEPLLGTWDLVGNKKKAQDKARIWFFWATDGSRLWQFSRRGPHSDGEVPVGACVTSHYTYDDTAKCLRMVPLGPEPEMQATWNSDQQMLTDTCPASSPDDGARLTSTKTIKPDGQLEERTWVTDKDGKVVGEGTWRAARVKSDVQR